MRRCFTFFLCLSIVFFACRRGGERSQTAFRPAFYCWKTELSIAPAEHVFLDSIGCNKLYIKFLDIGRNPENGAVEPLARLDASAAAEAVRGREVVPCVFLTNEIFKNQQPAETSWLAEKTAAALREIGAAFPDPNFREIQFDCDWTPSTRAAFFLFLKKIKPLLPPGSRTSATLRLHQFKRPAETGVPPADRGMLMLYNTGDLDAPLEENSILKINDLRKYLDGAPAEYPLPLDFALPVFSWAVVFRDGQFWRLLPGVRAADFLKNKKFNPLTINRFEVAEGTFVGGLYLQPGDRLRVEETTPALLSEAAVLARARVGFAPDATLAFFHLDTLAAQRFPAFFLRNLCAATSSATPEK